MKRCKTANDHDHLPFAVFIREVRELKVGITELFCILKSDKQVITESIAMITKDKVTENFCLIDEFDKNF